MIRSLAAGVFCLIIAAGAMTWLARTGDKPGPGPMRAPDFVPAVIPGHPVAPLPVKMDLDADKVALGEALFFDTRLSRDGTVSCASCHNLASGGDDGRRFPRGLGGAVGAINTPTVFNAAFNLAQFWDGRAASLEEQIDGPIHHPKEMGTTWDEILARLREDSLLAGRFRSLYPDGLSPANVKNAIATFERSLITPNARFDRYLRGEEDALTEKEMAGYGMFRDYGCASCHQGINIGGNMYQKLGVMADYFEDRGTVTPSDFGRYNVTKLESDRYLFKVPSLRNVELTAPYFHDGTAANLEDAVAVMARYQLGRTLAPHEIRSLVAFLKTLTGESRKERPAE